MKKLMIAILVMAAVGVYAQDVQTAMNGVAFDRNTGLFNIQQGGTWVIQLYQPMTDNGQTNALWYYKVIDGENTKPVKLSDKPKGNDTFTISGLNAGESIKFYLNPAQNGSNPSGIEELNNIHIITDPHGNPGVDSFTGKPNTVYGFEWGQNNNLSFINSGFEPTPTPSGQPLPGALTTMLVAGGCAAFLRKRKAARK